MPSIWKTVLAGLIVCTAGLPAKAQYNCDLPAGVICSKLPDLQQAACIKSMQNTASMCRRAVRQERFGSHEEHCKFACDVAARLVDLDRRMRLDAIGIVKQSGQQGTAWRDGALAFWRARGEGTCSEMQFADAKRTCEQHCGSAAVRRDIEELQGLAKGEDFLPIELPEFACAQGGSLEVMSRDERSGLQWLYPPGHARAAD
jgi:hypothetical protein